MSLSLPNHWMKNLFLGHMYLELQLNEEALKIYQNLVDGGFSKSTYIVSQMAVVYHNMRGKSSALSYWHVQTCIRPNSHCRLIPIGNRTLFLSAY